MNIMKYESKIWDTADLLRGCGIKESEWPSFMMPYFALVMIESRLLRMQEELINEIGEVVYRTLSKEELIDLARDRGQGYNSIIFEKGYTLTDICKNDTNFTTELQRYFKAFDTETQDLLGIETSAGEKFLDIKGINAKLEAKKVLFDYVKKWSEIDLKGFDNSEITTLEEHIKRKWADISAETAGEQYTPTDIIQLIAAIVGEKINNTDELLKIYDCSCGGGNMLFGVEDYLKEKFGYYTQTFGQDWNDALYALAKIESRFRVDSKIEHGNTLVDDKFSEESFDIVVANPPYGVKWKAYEKEVKNDKTGRFKYFPSISDGQLLFMQHLVSKLDKNGVGVVVHSGSTLFSGDAGSAESNIRKWLLDEDYVEAIIQLPTKEFFNTGIYTYLWILNKNKDNIKKNNVLLVDGSKNFVPLLKSKGDKRHEIDYENRMEIVKALIDYKKSSISKIFNKYEFYYNKQAIEMLKVDSAGRSIQNLLLDKKSKKLKLQVEELIYGQISIGCKGLIQDINVENIDETPYQVAKEEIENLIISSTFEQGLKFKSEGKVYSFDAIDNTILVDGMPIGLGKVELKISEKKATKTKAFKSILVEAHLTPLVVKEYEYIPYSSTDNEKNIDEFLSEYIKVDFEKSENTIGVEILFTKYFYKPEQLKATHELKQLIEGCNTALNELEKGLLS